MALHYRDRRQSPMFRDIGPASWSYHHFRIDNFNTLWFLAQRFQTHCSPCKVKIDTKVPQEVSTENSTLRKPRGLVYRFHIKHRGIDFFNLPKAETQSRQLQKLHVFGHARRSEDAHLRRL